MAAILATIKLDEAALKDLPSHELADLAIASLKIVSERFVAREQYFYAKGMLGVLTQLQQCARPGFESTIPELANSKRPRVVERPVDDSV